MARIVKKSGLRRAWLAYSTGDGQSGAYEIDAAGKIRRSVNVEHEEFVIGSNTKTMTALLFAQAFERGALSPEMTLEEAARRIERADEKAGKKADKLAKPIVVHPSLSKVTLRQLLWHRGGMPGPDHAQVRYSAVTNRDELMRGLLASGASSIGGFESGGYPFHYSDDGYALLGEILERLSSPRKTYEELLAQAIFEPLGMKSCHLHPRHHSSRLHEVESARMRDCGGTPAVLDEHVENWIWEFESALIAPGAAVSCSLGDWLKFERQLMNGLNGKVSEPALLRDAGSFLKLEQVHGEHFYSSGGLMVAKEKSASYHYGSNGGYFSLGWLDRVSGSAVSPDDAMAVVVVTTEAFAEGLFGKLFHSAELIREASRSPQPSR
jgi:CubicO group peptidase (beta-lactamase class C family)